MLETHEKNSLSKEIENTECQMEILERKGTIIKRRSSVDGVAWGAEKEPVSRMRGWRGRAEA